MNLPRFGYICFWAFTFSSLGVWASPLAISSPAFDRGKPIPVKFVLSGENVSPELHISNVPANAQSLVLIVDDPDAPVGLWTHWLVWNLPANTATIPEGNLPQQALQGENSNGHDTYDGPAPPAGTGVHRYFFHLMALDTTLSLPAGASRAALLKAMEGHVVGKAEMFGTYRYGQSD